MPKRLILFLVAVYFFSSFDLAWAGVVISEIKISPIEDRFIKLYNSDSSPVDLTNWYIQRKTQTGSSFGSLVSKTNFENKSIGAKSYFLISRSLAESDIVVESLTLTESNAIQIKNGNGEVVDKVCWGDISDCGSSNLPNPAPGQSIQVISQNTPTPEISSNSDNTIPNNSPTQTIIEPKTKIIEIPKIKTKITAKMLGFVGLPLFLEAATFGYGGEQLRQGRYFWNFGDADSKEIKLSDNQPFTHTYFYPGEYAISLDYYQNYYSNVPDVSEVIIIRIVPADISISGVGDEKDFFVELFNNTNYSADISNWTLSSSQKSFTMPQNTILVSKKKMIISPKITNFSIADKNALKLMTPQGNTVFSYSFLGEPVEVLVKNINPTNLLISENKNKKKNTTNFAIAENVVENLPALASRSDVVKQDSNFSPIIPIVTFFFIGASAGGVYFIRRKKVAIQPGNDFEILDE